MAKTREELEAEAIEQYSTMMRSFKNAAIWMEIELTVPQLRTLMVLGQQGPMVIGQIAQSLNVGLSTGGHLVDRLVQAGLALREEDSGDRRRTVARLSPRGQELLARLMIGKQQMQARIHQLDEEDLRALLQGLHAINRLAQQEAILSA